MKAIRHAAAVVGGYGLLFAWLFAYAPLTDSYLTESDLYEYYLPIFLAPITTWSPFEFSGLPAFADPGDFSLYPLHLISRLAGSWTGLIASAFVLAASLMYGFMYRLTGSWRAAAVAGLAYGLSEAMLERTPHLGTLHAFAWLPLVLLAIEELRGPSRRRWIAIGGVAMACAILAGHPQPAIYTAYAALLYAVIAGRAERQGAPYYRAVVAVFVLSGLLAAVKLLPLVEASTLMARQIVSFGQFAAHTNTPAQSLSVLFPSVLHEGREAPTYVGLATLALAFVGASRLRHSWRAAYCVGVALFAFLIGMGTATPIAQVAYWIVPLYDNFRGVARHLFLFAFGAAALAGFGMAAIERNQVGRAVQTRAIGVLLLLVVAGAALLASLPQAFQYEVRADLPWALPIWHAGVWIQFGLALASAAVVLCLRPGRPIGRAALAAVAVVLLTDMIYSLPYPMSAAGIMHITMPRQDAAPSVHALGIAGELQPLQQRALATGGTARDALLPGAFARLWRIPIAGAYGPMLLDRYSRLATMGTSGQISPMLLAGEDATLDLLAVRLLIIRPDEIAPPTVFERNGLSWSTPRLELPIGRPECGHRYARRVSLPLPGDIDIARVALVAHLGCSEDVPHGATVATLRVIGHEGPLATATLRAGYETAETALAIPEVRARARHQPVPPFDDPNAGDLHVYRTDVRLATPQRVLRLDIEGEATGGWLTIDRMTLVDAAGGSHPQSSPRLWLNDATRWRPSRTVSTTRGSDRGRDEAAADESEIHLIENTRALPRAWVVDRVVGLSDHDGIESIRRSQLPDGRPFDPRHTAIIDVDAAPPQTSFHPGARSAAVRQAYDRRVELDVSTEGGGFLVLSDVWYPGWRARIDGEPATVYRANVALRGVIVPPGTHRVEFELVSATMLAGAALSIGALLAVAALFLPAVTTPARGRTAHGSRSGAV